MNTKVDLSIDCKGLSCPMPIVRTKKAVDSMQPGEVLEVVATDPGSVADVKSWVERTGNQFIGTAEEEGAFKHYIRKSNPNELKPETKHPHVISNEELQQKLGSNPVILDVREPAEYAFGHVPGARSIPLGQLEAVIGELKNGADQEVYVICRTGNRSDVACQLLTEKGMSNVKNVMPGMTQWNGPLEK